MLKAFTIQDLRPGMVLGKDAVDMQGRVILAQNTPFQKEMRLKLEKAGIGTVLVSFPDPAEEIAPEREVLVDNVYAGIYQEAYGLLDSLLGDLCWHGSLDMAALKSLYASNLFTATDDSRAISQLHNIAQDGSPVICHALACSILAHLMTRWLGMTPRERHNLLTAALLFDVGKLKIPEDVLTKKGRLTFAEEAQVKEYPKMSCTMVRGTTLGTNDDVLDAILQHRERMDGSGFPNKLRGSKISPLARILGIIDLYVSLATKSDAKTRRSPFDIFALLDAGVYNGTYDATYAVPFMRHVCHALYGNWVLLSNGAIGRIVYLDESRVTALPIVQTAAGEFFDMGKDKELHIQRILAADEAAQFASEE